VFDHTCDAWRDSYRTSGIEQAVKEAAARSLRVTARAISDCCGAQGRRLREVKEHELILQSDVLINVPVLKSHGGARLTVAMKNLMGIVWDAANGMPTICISALLISPVTASRI